MGNLFYLLKHKDMTEQMNGVVITEKGKVEFSKTIDVPKPGPGQVLIKLECTPINPSDTYTIDGRYDGVYHYPLTPGGEGSGTVVATGDGDFEKALQGKRVGFTKMGESEEGQIKTGGAWSEHVVTTAQHCIELDDSVSWEQGACSFVNPLCAIGLLDKVAEYKGKSIIQTAAASQLGRMIIRLCKERDITCVNVVRRPE